MIAISTDTADEAVKTVDEHGIAFPVLYDTDGRVSRAWGVFNLLGDGRAAPSTFILDAAGRLTVWKIGQNIMDRPSAGETLAAVEQVVREGTG